MMQKDFTDNLLDTKENSIHGHTIVTYAFFSDRSSLLNDHDNYIYKKFFDTLYCSV